MTPFQFITPDHELLFLQRLTEVILATVMLPGDDRWHEVELKFDMLCPKGINDEPTVNIGNTGFMLGGDG